jgi:adenine/guanine/hypoxanthine permease
LIERFFKLQENGTTLRMEVVAGFTTFAAMAYILAVNPMILATTGMDRAALVTATALASAIMTAVMGLLTNYPIAVAPGMGLNAFFAYTVCGAMHVPWPAALGLVFWGGMLFLLLSLTGIRRMIVDSIPYDLKSAISCGIGLFIAFIGFRNGGLVVGNAATLVAIGRVSDPSVVLVLFGLVLTAALVWWRLKGAIIISILITTAIGLIVPAGGGRVMVTTLPPHFISRPASLSPIFLALDLQYLWHNFRTAFGIVLSILFVDLIENMGTLIGVCKRAGLLDANGNLPKIGRAFVADAGSAMVGSCLGTSTVTSYVESAAGVEAGGRTGLTGLTISGCFLLSLLFSPVILSIPAAATAPALIIVGIFMMQGVSEIDMQDFSIAVPAFVTMVIMPLTYSITNGIALGLITYAGLMVATRRAAVIRPMAYLLAGLCIAHYLLG